MGYAMKGIVFRIGGKILLVGGISMILLCIPRPAFANMGMPMILVMIPAFALSIIPIILIEAVYLSRKIHLTWGVAGKATTIANLVSTILGIPATWFLLVVIQIATGGSSSYGTQSFFEKVIAVTWQAPWLIPYEGDLHWMIPTAALVLLIPFYFVSWYSEYWITKKILKEIEPALVKKTVRDANAITYSLLTLWPIAMLIMPN